MGACAYEWVTVVRPPGDVKTFCRESRVRGESLLCARGLVQGGTVICVIGFLRRSLVVILSLFRAPAFAEPLVSKEKR